MNGSIKSSVNNTMETSTDSSDVSSFKKGDRKGPSNYRAIALPRAIAKLYSRV